MAWLGRYYAEKIRGAIDLYRYQKGGNSRTIRTPACISRRRRHTGGSPRDLVRAVRPQVLTRMGLDARRHPRDPDVRRSGYSGASRSALAAHELAVREARERGPHVGPGQRERRGPRPSPTSRTTRLDRAARRRRSMRTRASTTQAPVRSTLTGLGRAPESPGRVDRSAETRRRMSRSAASSAGGAPR